MSALRAMEESETRLMRRVVDAVGVDARRDSASVAGRLGRSWDQDEIVLVNDDVEGLSKGVHGW